MPCISPTMVYRDGHTFLNPCRHCSQCIASRVDELSFLASKDLQAAYKRGYGASFITLTYNDNALPIAPTGYRTLVKPDVQKFWKRLRFELSENGFKHSLKHITAGEYGDEQGRPHYHAVIIGLDDFLANKYVHRAWDKQKFGLADVEALGSLSGIRYTLKYLSKTNPYGRVKELYDFAQVQPPFVVHSQKLGFDWIVDHADQIIASRFVYSGPNGRKLYPKKVRDVVAHLKGIDVRPYVQEYMSSINTHGLSLDDYQCEQAYFTEKNYYKKSIQDGKPAYFALRPRLPVFMRNLADEANYKSLLQQV